MFRCRRRRLLPGEPDANELYPNDRMPTGIAPEESCLELYRRFVKNPNAFVLDGANLEQPKLNVGVRLHGSCQGILDNSGQL